MRQDNRDLLKVLKAEFDFLQNGLYHADNAKNSWRPRFLLEDSPSCPNYGAPRKRLPCKECALMALVPPPFQGRKVPCRYIPLDSEGQTLDSLYRTAKNAEAEEIFRNWLRSTIEAMQENQTSALKDEEMDIHKAAGQPLFRKSVPKCANSGCKVVFCWRDGGKFFRFKSAQADENSQSGLGPHQVRHYWLCKDCSRLFTLVYKDAHGVVLQSHSAAMDSQSTDAVAGSRCQPDTAIAVSNIT